MMKKEEGLSFFLLPSRQTLFFFPLFRPLQSFMDGAEEQMRQGEEVLLEAAEEQMRQGEEVLLEAAERQLARTLPKTPKTPEEALKMHGFPGVDEQMTTDEALQMTPDEALKIDLPIPPEPTVEKSFQSVPQAEPALGFQSGLGIRKALSLHWGNTVRLLRGSTGQQEANDMHTSTSMVVASEQVLPLEGSKEDAVGNVAQSAAVREPTEGEEAGESIEANPAQQNPWSPVVRPLSKGLENAKSMGLRLVEIWDIRDVFDDVQQQRDYWRRRREERRLKEELKAAELKQAEAAATIPEGAVKQDELQSRFRSQSPAAQSTSHTHANTHSVPLDMQPQDALANGCEGSSASTPYILPGTPRQATREGRRRHRGALGVKEHSEPDDSGGPPSRVVEVLAHSLLLPVRAISSSRGDDNPLLSPPRTLFSSGVVRGVESQGLSSASE
jgi:hypothetical protein